MARRRFWSLLGSVALHVAVAALIAALPARVRGAGESAADAGGTISTVVVGPEALTATAGDQVLAADAGGGSAPRDESDLRIERVEFDIARLHARRNWLFPFLTTDLLFLERSDDTPGEPIGQLTSMFASLQRPASRPPLSISDAELQNVVDRAWSRRERWSRFSEIVALVKKYDANHGRVPEVLRAYLDQNLLQPYYDGRLRDSRFWAMLDCVADHVEFIDWVRSFARQHPSSRTTTLLFLLDEFAQGSRDTLLMLLSTDPERDLARTKSVDVRAYDFAVSLRRHYAEWLQEHESGSPNAIRRRYDDLRLRVLSTIIESSPGGYRAADARFLAGEILFNRNDTPGALRLWREMRPDPRDSYVKTYSDILRELQSPGGPKSSDINRILGAEYRRWLDFSEVRLRQFGYAFDTF